MWLGKKFSEDDFNTEALESLTKEDMGDFSEFKNVQVGNIQTWQPEGIPGESVMMLVRVNEDNVWSRWMIPYGLGKYIDIPFKKRAELYYKNNLS